MISIKQYTSAFAAKKQQPRFLHSFSVKLPLRQVAGFLKRGLPSSVTSHAESKQKTNFSLRNKQLSLSACLETVFHGQSKSSKTNFV